MVFESIKNVRQTYNYGASKERIASFVCDDLREAGYDPELIKPNPKKPKTWYVDNKSFLTTEEKKKFDKLKQESFEIWRDAEKDNIKDIMKSLR